MAMSTPARPRSVVTKNPPPMRHRDGIVPDGGMGTTHSTRARGRPAARRLSEEASATSTRPRRTFVPATRRPDVSGWIRCWRADQPSIGSPRDHTPTLRLLSLRLCSRRDRGIAFEQLVGAARWRQNSGQRRWPPR
jgi:hypothetical protein